MMAVGENTPSASSDMFRFMIVQPVRRFTSVSLVRACVRVGDFQCFSIYAVADVAFAVGSKKLRLQKMRPTGLNTPVEQ